MPNKSIAKPLNKSKSNRQIVALFVYVAILVSAIVFGSYFFVRYNQINAKYLAIPDIKNDATVAKIGKLMELPNDEKPSMYEIKDKNKLTTTAASKEFFEKAADGDVVLVYTKANLSVLYRPNGNKVIKSDKADKLSTINVAVISPSDLQDQTVKQLESKFANIYIVDRQAPKVEATQSYVADATGTNAKATQELADKLGLQVGQLPEGETKPEGASLIVVIAGQPTQPAP